MFLSLASSGPDSLDHNFQLDSFRNAIMPRCLITLLATCLLVGCGQSAYENRLAATAGYYRYINETESVLGEEWRSRGPVGGIEIRPPAGFRRLPEPVDEEDEEGNIISRGVDGRQPVNIPGFYQGELPGIEGAWQKSFNVKLANGQQKFTARMYLLARQSVGNSENELPFRDVVYHQLEADMNVEGSNTWLRESYPARDLYTRALDYQEMRFSPGISVGGFIGESVTIQLNAREDSGKEVVLLWVLPSGGLDSGEMGELKAGVAKSLQSLVIRKPRDNSGEPAPSNSGKSKKNKSDSPARNRPPI